MVLLRVRLPFEFDGADVTSLSSQSAYLVPVGACVTVRSPDRLTGRQEGDRDGGSCVDEDRRLRHVERTPAMIVTMAGWRLEHTYAALPRVFHSPAAPTAVREPRLVAFNRSLATMLGLEPEALERPEGAAIFAGNAMPEGGRPIAQAYAGHQFGHFTTLGDGRAILLGEQITPLGDRMDIQLKGAGQTPFSRRGDGRAALGPMLREYVISEAMHALGIPTTRSLAVVMTGEPVYRETMLQGAVLTRVAASHIRVGTMQWAAAHDDAGAARALADYTRTRHYAELADSPEPYLALFQAILARQASLIARWQMVGFVHGVMNTDNMALSGETIDYGPCAFMDTYDPATVFSSIDHGGRYAYGSQPPIAQWNLARLAEAMLPLFDPDVDRAVERATAVLDRFPGLFEQHRLDGMRAKLGLFTQEQDDEALVSDLLAWMHRQSADFTNTFRLLTRGRLVGGSTNADAELEAWHHRLEARRGRQPQPPAEVEALMRRHNPAFIPRNHKVEEALLAATSRDDFSVMERLLEVLATPYDHERDLPVFNASMTGERPYRTFCGT
jgi:serine/tyrosine/threonine adenylyltransferase